MPQATYEFDPPFGVPPHGTAQVHGGLEFCTVMVKDKDGNCLSFGRYQRIERGSNKFKLISGTAWKPPKVEEAK